MRCFAGLRTAECDRLTEGGIRAGSGYIEVTAGNTKTRRRRLSAISQTLHDWLALRGRLPLGNSGQRIAELVKLSGVPRPNNATRHSFVSYSVSMHGAKDTALLAGHIEDIHFQHCRALVAKADAESFFAIRPALPASMPHGTNSVAVALEVSTNLTLWATATNGVYVSGETPRFFRIKAVK